MNYSKFTYEKELIGEIKECSRVPTLINYILEK
jgi:hypothetical protein